MSEYKECEPLTPENTPAGWELQSGSDFHVALFADSLPNSLIFAPQYNTINLLDDCVYSATMTGQRMINEGICRVIEVKYCQVPGQWPHIRLFWTPTDE